MKHYLSLVMLTFLSIFTNIAGHGFDMLTPVEIACEGQWPIFFIHNYHEDGDRLSVKSYDLTAQTSVNCFVEEIATGTTNCYFKLGFDWDTISCSPAQAFYLPEEKQWKAVEQLKVGDVLLAKDNKLVPVRSVQFVNEQLKVYLLEVEKTHCFFVGKHAVLTHNIALELSLSLVVAFGEGAAAGATAGSFFGPVSIAGGLAVGGLVGLTVAVIKNRQRHYYEWHFDPLLKKGYGSPANPSVPRGGSASSPCGPDDDCLYVDAPYHGREGNSRKSPRPRNGQEALRNSIPVDNDLRVAIQDGEFVVMRRTSEQPQCVFHGYRTDWDGVPDKAQKALYKNKLVNLKGKIL